MFQEVSTYFKNHSYPAFFRIILWMFFFIPRVGTCSEGEGGVTMDLPALASSYGKDVSEGSGVPEVPSIPSVQDFNSLSPPPMLESNNLPQLEITLSGSLAPKIEGSHLELMQGPENTIAHFKTFNIGQGYTVHVRQHPHTHALFRVTGQQDISRIDGTLKADANLYLVTPNGLLIGKNGILDVGNLVLTTHPITDESFLAFSQRQMLDLAEVYRPHAGIINKGTIKAAGFAALVAPIIVNEGLIQGNVLMGSGAQANLAVGGNDLVQLRVSGTLKKTLIAQASKGKISAQGKKVVITAGDVERAADGIINLQGTIDASDGVIVVEGRRNIEEKISASLSVEGTAGKGGTIYLKSPTMTVGKTAVLNARSQQGEGGKIHVLGDNIYIKGDGNRGALLDASGQEGGGEILIGGNYRGKGPEPNAQYLKIEDGVQMKADALSDGNAGTIINYASLDAILWGKTSAQALGATGDGGYIEYSGKRSLSFPRERDYWPKLTKRNGNPGKFVLDPANITILTGGGDPIGGSGSSLNLDPSTIAAYLVNSDLYLVADTSITATNWWGANPSGTYTLGLQAPNVTLNVDISTNGQLIFSNISSLSGSSTISSPATTINLVSDFILSQINFNQSVSFLSPTQNVNSVTISNSGFTNAFTLNMPINGPLALTNVSIGGALSITASGSLTATTLSNVDVNGSATISVGSGSLTLNNVTANNGLSLMSNGAGPVALHAVEANGGLTVTAPGESVAFQNGTFMGATNSITAGNITMGDSSGNNVPDFNTSSTTLNASSSVSMPSNLFYSGATFYLPNTSHMTWTDLGVTLSWGPSGNPLNINGDTINIVLGGNQAIATMIAAFRAGSAIFTGPGLALSPSIVYLNATSSINFNGVTPYTEAPTSNVFTLTSPSIALSIDLTFNGPTVFNTASLVGNNHTITGSSLTINPTSSFTLSDTIFAQALTLATSSYSSTLNNVIANYGLTITTTAVSTTLNNVTANGGLTITASGQSVELLGGSFTGTNTITAASIAMGDSFGNNVPTVSNVNATTILNASIVYMPMSFFYNSGQNPILPTTCAMNWTDQEVALSWNTNGGPLLISGTTIDISSGGASRIANMLNDFRAGQAIWIGRNTRLAAGAITVNGTTSIAFEGDYSDAVTPLTLTLTSPLITLNGGSINSHGPLVLNTESLVGNGETISASSVIINPTGSFTASDITVAQALTIINPSYSTTLTNVTANSGLSINYSGGTWTSSTAAVTITGGSFAGTNYIEGGAVIIDNAASLFPTGVFNTSQDGFSVLDTGNFPTWQGLTGASSFSTATTTFNNITSLTLENMTFSMPFAGVPNFSAFNLTNITANQGLFVSPSAIWQKNSWVVPITAAVSIDGGSFSGLNSVTGGGNFALANVSNFFNNTQSVFSSSGTMSLSTVNIASAITLSNSGGNALTLTNVTASSPLFIISMSQTLTYGDITISGGSFNNLNINGRQIQINGVSGSSIPMGTSSIHANSNGSVSLSYINASGSMSLETGGAVSLINVSANAGLSIGSGTTPSSATLGGGSFQGTNSITAGNIIISGITNTFGATTLNTQGSLSLSSLTFTGLLQIQNGLSSTLSNITANSGLTVNNSGTVSITGGSFTGTNTITAGNIAIGDSSGNNVPTVGSTNATTILNAPVVSMPASFFYNPGQNPILPTTCAMTWTDQGITLSWSSGGALTISGVTVSISSGGAPGIANMLSNYRTGQAIWTGANIRLPAGPITVIGSSSIAFGGADYSDASTAYLLTLTAPAITLNGVNINSRGPLVLNTAVLTGVGQTINATSFIINPTTNFTISGIKFNQALVILNPSYSTTLTNVTANSGLSINYSGGTWTPSTAPITITGGSFTGTNYIAGGSVSINNAASLFPTGVFNTTQNGSLVEDLANFLRWQTATGASSFSTATTTFNNITTLTLSNMSFNTFAVVPSFSALTLNNITANGGIYTSPFAEWIGDVVYSTTAISINGGSFPGLNSVTGGGNLSLTNVTNFFTNSQSVLGVVGPPEGIVTLSTGTISLSGVTIGSAVTLSNQGGNAITLTNVTANNPLTITSEGGIGDDSYGPITITGGFFNNLNITGGVIQINGTSGSPVSMGASSISAQSNSSISLSYITASGAMNLMTGGAVSLTNVSANAGLSIGSSETTPSSATLGGGSFQGTNSITAGSISISGITSSFGSTTLNTQTALSLSSLTFTGLLQIQSSLSTALTNITANSGLTVNNSGTVSIVNGSFSGSNSINGGTVNLQAIGALGSISLNASDITTDVTSLQNVTALTLNVDVLNQLSLLEPSTTFSFVKTGSTPNQFIAVTNTGSSGMTIDAPVSLLISSLLVSTTALPVTLSNNSHITVGSQINLPDVLPLLTFTAPTVAINAGILSTINALTATNGVVFNTYNVTTTLDSSITGISAKSITFDASSYSSSQVGGGSFSFPTMLSNTLSVKGILGSGSAPSTYIPVYFSTQDSPSYHQNPSFEAVKFMGNNGPTALGGAKPQASTQLYFDGSGQSLQNPGSAVIAQLSVNDVQVDSGITNVIIKNVLFQGLQTNGKPLLFNGGTVLTLGFSVGGVQNIIVENPGTTYLQSVVFGTTNATASFNAATPTGTLIVTQSSTFQSSILAGTSLTLGGSVQTNNGTNPINATIYSNTINLVPSFAYTTSTNTLTFSSSTGTYITSSLSTPSTGSLVFAGAPLFLGNNTTSTTLATATGASLTMSRGISAAIAGANVILNAGSGLNITQQVAQSNNFGTLKLWGRSVTVNPSASSYPVRATTITTMNGSTPGVTGNITLNGPLYATTVDLETTGVNGTSIGGGGYYGVISGSGNIYADILTLSANANSYGNLGINLSGTLQPLTTGGAVTLFSWGGISIGQLGSAAKPYGAVGTSQAYLINVGTLYADSLNISTGVGSGENIINPTTNGGRWYINQLTLGTSGALNILIDTTTLTVLEPLSAQSGRTVSLSTNCNWGGIKLGPIGSASSPYNQVTIQNGNATYGVTVSGAIYTNTVSLTSAGTITGSGALIANGITLNAGGTGGINVSGTFTPLSTGGTVLLLSGGGLTIGQMGNSSSAYSIIKTMNGSSPGVSGNIILNGPLYASTIDLEASAGAVTGSGALIANGITLNAGGAGGINVSGTFTPLSTGGTVLLLSGAGLTIGGQIGRSNAPYNIVTTLNGSSPGVAGDIAVDASIYAATIALYAQSGHTLTVGSTATFQSPSSGSSSVSLTAPQLLIPVGNNLTLNGYRSVTFASPTGVPSFRLSGAVTLTGGGAQVLNLPNNLSFAGNTQLTAPTIQFTNSAIDLLTYTVSLIGNILVPQDTTFSSTGGNGTLGLQGSLTGTGTLTVSPSVLVTLPSASLTLAADKIVLNNALTGSSSTFLTIQENTGFIFTGSIATISSPLGGFTWKTSHSIKGEISGNIYANQVTLWTPDAAFGPGVIFTPSLTLIPLLSSFPASQRGVSIQSSSYGFQIWKSTINNTNFSGLQTVTIGDSQHTYPMEVNGSLDLPALKLILYGSPIYIGLGLDQRPNIQYMGPILRNDPYTSLWNTLQATTEDYNPTSTQQLVTQVQPLHDMPMAMVPLGKMDHTQRTVTLPDEEETSAILTQSGPPVEGVSQTKDISSQQDEEEEDVKAQSNGKLIIRGSLNNRGTKRENASV